jgi:MATE family multidrug resistance protein
MGMSYALETLCGQAYGARQYSLLGLFMQRAMVVLNATSILVALAWANMEHILLALGQDETISEKAGEYTLCLIPMLFAYATGQPLIKFLQAQSLMIPLLLCTVSAFVCHVPICYAMVYKSGLGSRGAALATSLSNWINVLLLMAYVNFSRSCAATRRPLSFQAFHGLTVFLRLAIPSAVMTWCAFAALFCEYTFQNLRMVS